MTVHCDKFMSLALFSGPVPRVSRFTAENQAGLAHKIQCAMHSRCLFFVTFGLPMYNYSICKAMYVTRHFVYQTVLVFSVKTLKNLEMGPGCIE